eukprot:CAMPEP_0119340456 /NCGR_PEP_ID=MMETSP1333-20130426/100407_1 /TAXON_ID=418940 /ORGANISM="Scyphosphaera apsteinii, Strain RCC1455" /LENGTH=72 /DNA_ID=CAMNT_0007352211 /DNA_START=184 /DNA_END=399 /DNA_ORIENTATION=+
MPDMPKKFKLSKRGIEPHRVEADDCERVGGYTCVWSRNRFSQRKEQVHRLIEHHGATVLILCISGTLASDLP